jgi:hypothetical protein
MATRAYRTDGRWSLCYVHDQESRCAGAGQSLPVQGQRPAWSQHDKVCEGESIRDGFLIDVVHARTDSRSRKEMLIQRHHNSVVTPMSQNLGSFHITSECGTDCVGRNGHLLVFNKEQVPIIYGWHKGAKVQLEMTACTETSAATSSLRQLRELFAVQKKDTAYIAWTKNGRILQICKDKSILAFHPNLEIVRIFLSTSDYVIILGRATHIPSTTSPLRVWKIRCEDVRPDATLTEIGAFDLIQGDPVVVHATINNGSIIYPHRIRIWTEGGKVFEGKFW